MAQNMIVVILVLQSDLRLLGVANRPMRDPRVREVSIRHGAVELAPKRLGWESALDFC